MSRIRFGCQFYTWHMSGERYVGQVPHIAGIIRGAGFAGIEPETCMLGSYRHDSRALKEVLDLYGLELGAVALACRWREPAEDDEERREADCLLDYVRAFPGAHLLLSQLPGDDRSDLRERQKNALACVNAVAARAADRGIDASFHNRVTLRSSMPVWGCTHRSQPMWGLARLERYAVELLAQRKLEVKPLIGSRVPFERAAEAYAMIDRQRGEGVKTLLTYGH